jgi:hypothetical protein
MRKRLNPDYLRGWRVVVTTVLWAMLSKKFVHHVLTEIRRTQYASIGEWPLHKECKPDQMI